MKLEKQHCCTGSSRTRYTLLGAPHSGAYWQEEQNFEAVTDERKIEDQVIEEFNNEVENQKQICKFEEISKRLRSNLDALGHPVNPKMQVELKDEHDYPRKRVEQGTCCFDWLPDELICSIFGKLKDSKLLLICSAVCKRWKQLWNLVDTLHFKFNGPEGRDIVSNVLLRCAGIKELIIDYYDCDDERDMYKWVDHVAPVIEHFQLLGDGAYYSDLWSHLMNCHRLKEMKLNNALMECEFVCFRRLENCILQHLDLDDLMLESFVEACPVLRELTVNECYGLGKMTLRSSSLKKLCVCGVYTDEIAIDKVTVEMESLEYLDVSYVEELEIHKQQLRKFRLVGPSQTYGSSWDSVSSLSVEGAGWTLQRFSEVLNRAKNVRLLQVTASFLEKPSIALDKFFHPFSCLEKLVVGDELYIVFFVILLYSGFTSAIRHFTEDLMWLAQCLCYDPEDDERAKAGTNILKLKHIYMILTNFSRDPVIFAYDVITCCPSLRLFKANFSQFNSHITFCETVNEVLVGVSGFANPKESDPFMRALLN